MNVPRARAAGAAAAGLATAAAVLGVLAVPAAYADTRPPSTSTPTTVSADSLPTTQINGVAWSQVVKGSTVFVGGKFTKARPAGAAAGTSESTRNNMLSYNVTNGVLNPGFAPSFNGQVRAVATSPDGTVVYAGGDFTSVNGVTRNRLVALNASTGAVLSSFAPNVNGPVYAVAATSSAVYFGGSFTAVNGSSRSRSAAVTLTGGLKSFAPTVTGGSDYSPQVRAIVVSPDGTKVVLGGNFGTLNGSSSPGSGMGQVDAATGRTNQAWAVGKLIYNHTQYSAIYSLTSDGTNVYGTGYALGGTTYGNLEGAFNASWSGGTINWIEDCHGDSYSVAATSSVVYVSSHSHFCGNIGSFPETNPRHFQYGTSYTKAATGTVKTNTISNYYNFGGKPAPTQLVWYPDFAPGTFTGQNQATWSVAAGGDYVVYGGEFPKVNSGAQQGLARFAVSSVAPNKQGPRVAGSAWTPTGTTLSSGAKISWPANYDRDNQQLTYTLFRGSSTTPIYTTKVNSRIWFDRPTISFSDTAVHGSQTYYVKAADPFGNTVKSAVISVTAG